MAATVDRRCVVLVEGESDRRALLTYAARLGRDLGDEGVEVVSMSGVTNIRAFARDLGPHGIGVPLAGLYDAPDERTIRHGLAAAGIGSSSDDPAQQGWPREALLHRFFGVRSGRKAKYAELLVDALDPDRAPEPLAALLGRI